MRTVSINRRGSFDDVVDMEKERSFDVSVPICFCVCLHLVVTFVE
jgi:hypothetical protein